MQAFCEIFYTATLYFKRHIFLLNFPVFLFATATYMLFKKTNKQKKTRYTDVSNSADSSKEKHFNSSTDAHIPFYYSEPFQDLTWIYLTTYIKWIVPN